MTEEIAISFVPKKELYRSIFLQKSYDAAKNDPKRDTWDQPAAEKEFEERWNDLNWRRQFVQDNTDCVPRWER